MINQVLLWGIFIVICAVAFFGLRFFRPSEEPGKDGFTDRIGDGETVYKGYTDKIRPDIYVRPRTRHRFWGDKYTPVWLVKKRKEEEKDPEKETEEG